MARSNLRTIRLTPSSLKASGATTLQQNGNIVNSTDNVRYLEMAAAYGRLGDEPLEFVFAFPPQQISYSELAPEIVEIRRPGRKPLVALASYKARKVQLQFLMAVPFDGLFIDIEKDIDVLRRIAQSGRPVVFFNTDQFLGTEYGETFSESAPFWSITDMSMESVRRNSSGKITSAQVTLSLVENVNEGFALVTPLQLIVYEENPTDRNPVKTNQPKEDDFIKWTDAWDRLGRPLVGD